MPRPRWNLDAYADAWTGLKLPVRFAYDVHIDQAGRVVAARQLTGSGLPGVDRPLLLAVYDARFDPTLDDQGRPVPDRLRFEVNLR